MTEVSLLLEAPNGAWANHVESLIRQALLGQEGHLTLVAVGDALWDITEASWCFLTGVAVSDEPQDKMLAAVTTALHDFEIDTRRLDSGMTQLVVRPARQRPPVDS